KKAKENYYKLHKQSDQINATYSTKKSDPQAKPKEVEKVMQIHFPFFLIDHFSILFYYYSSKNIHPFAPNI
ncbi:hypothetical protein, partial [Salmonella enterica]|uniref:hypothetical protein n=1 Tax=Salmonella enterica TaxID=28901 RepID=UPI003CFB94BE